MHHVGESAAPLPGQGADDMQPDNGRPDSGEQGKSGFQGEVPRRRDAGESCRAAVVRRGMPGSGILHHEQGS